ncbi:probable ATP-dependent RNA helicase DHX34 isoform X1 [Drosophila bipectinata]|uniref:probable ATP-dependent RNA helicase DHX34 isoform X1 n=1 Tax=Drosophila bipectinata TaxID=42026 RepID=UPI001C8AA324|nr:probable ATP-dependent RNA helicase DHX34 isoform X1 [Drosophila bipectinata]
MSRKQRINLINFSFLDHKAELRALFRAKGRREPCCLVESETDFWQFIGKYEAMMRATGQPELPQLLSSKELSSPQPYHRTKHLAMELDEEQMLQEARGEMEAQFRQLILIYLDFRQKEKFQRIRKLRQAQRSLPIARFRCDLREALDNSRVLIVAGDTGCGKSTQVPQFLYDFGYRSIACTQPRRLACVSLSKRVAHELLDDYGSRVGFQIRFEKSRTQHTNITFITEGLLLRQLAVGANLDQYDALILDEIHERNLFGDFLLGVTKCLLRARPQLKLILMSATINVQLFHNYFQEDGARLVQVPGRLFPIKLRYVPPPALELIAGQSGSSTKHQSGRLDPAPFVQVLSLIDQQYPTSERGDVLIFVSGVNEIESVVAAVEEYATKQQHWIVLPLHSGLALAEQDKVFDYAQEGSRKCIVSTNIAETSLTVDGVRFVIDSGKVKEMSYDAAVKGQRLKEFWVSKSSAEQRKGRAGRTGPGVCFRLYSQAQFDTFEPYPAPEIHRMPLDTMLLQMISMGLPNVRDFPFIEAPKSEQVEQTILALKQHCALSVEEKITPLGSSLANLPVELSIGKMLLMGCVFPEVEQLLTLAAMLSVQNPLTTRAQTDHRCERERQPFESDQGDLFTILRCFREWLQLKLRREETRKWCHRLGIEEQRFYEVTKLRNQFQRILESCGMAVGSDSGSGPGSSSQLTSAERLSRHGELIQLKALKRRQRFEQPRQRKLLKHQHQNGEGQGLDKQDEDMRDVDLRMRHDARQLARLERSARLDRHRDVMLLKLLIASGFYPQLAVGDEFNYCKGGAQQFFHSRLKPFLSQHPNSHFAKYFDLLQLSDSDMLTKPHYYSTKHPLSSRHQILCYQSLLETAKPYLMNCIRLPCAQTLLLFGFAIDTNAGLTQIVCDSWLGIDLPSPGSGMQLLSRAIELRRRWSGQLYAKLNELSDKQETHLTANSESNELWHDLLDYMALDVAYAVRRLLPADLKRLYTHQAPSERIRDLTENPFAPGYVMTANDEKGGINVSEHVVYACLGEQQWTMAMDAVLREQPWKCTHCDVTQEEFDVLEQLIHRSQCHGSRRKSKVSSTPNSDKGQDPAPSRSTSSSSDSYYCETCKCQLPISRIEILRHRRQCVQIVKNDASN